MPSMLSAMVRTISKRLSVSKNNKEVAVDSFEKDQAHWRDLVKQSSATRIPKHTLAQISNTNPRNSASKSPAPPPAEAPKGGPEIQTSGDYEGLGHKELNIAMRHDAQRQEELVDLASEIIAATVQRNDARECAQGELSIFEGDPKRISPDNFVRRIMKYGGCSPCCLVMGFAYLQRLKESYRTVRLSSRTLVRLYTVAVMSASKVYDDCHLSNKQWADIAGISLAEMNQLELQFLFRIQFDLCVDRSTYNEYVANMLGCDAAGQAGREAPTEAKKEAIKEGGNYVPKDAEEDALRLADAFRLDCNVTKIATSL